MRALEVREGGGGEGGGRGGGRFSHTAEGARSRHNILSLQQNTLHFDNSKTCNFLFKFVL